MAAELAQSLDKGNLTEAADFLRHLSPESALEAIRRSALQPYHHPTLNGYSGYFTDSRKYSLDKPTKDSLADGAIDTDIGNAQRFIRRHGDKVYYVKQWGWLVHDGVRYRKDDLDVVHHLAQETARGILTEAAEMSRSDKERDTLISWAKRSETKARITAMLELASSDPGLRAPPDVFDDDHHLLNCENYAVDLRTGGLIDHSVELLVTKSTGVNFQDGAKSEFWEKFLLDIMGGKQHLVDYLQRVIGYAATGLTGEQCFWILWGKGNNGKSKFLKAISGALGDYAMHTPASTFLERKGDSPTNDLARLRGARFVTAVEPDSRFGFSESVIKAFTGQDTQTARFLHKEFFEFENTAKLFISVNEKPRIRGDDEGIWRRPKILGFTQKFTDDPKLVKEGKGREAMPSDELDAALEAARPATLAWIIEGTRLYLEQGLKHPAEVEEWVREYRLEMDPLYDFLQDCTKDNEFGDEHTSELYRCYEIWCKQNGAHPVKPQSFGKRMTNKGYLAAKVNGRRLYRGLSFTLHGQELLIDDATSHDDRESQKRLG